MTEVVFPINHSLPACKQSIITKYLPATNCRGSRIKVVSNARMRTFSYSGLQQELGKSGKGFDFDGIDTHTLAARKLAHEIGWGEFAAVSSLPDGCNYHYVFTF